MTCSRMELDYLIEYVAGILLPNDMQQVAHHLARCSACQDEIKQLRCLMKDIADLPQSVKPERDLWPSVAQQIVEPDWLVLKLKEAIALRDLDAATHLAENHRDVIADLDPSQPDAAPLLGLFTQWIDMGFGHRGSDTGFSYLDLVKAALAKFPRTPRASLRLLDCAHLEMVEGLLAIRAEEYDRAIPHFHFVTSVDSQLGDKDLVIVANYAIASASSRKGAYKDALHYVDVAIAIARDANREEM